MRTESSKITKDYLVLSPAYGRSYKSKTEVEADFKAGKDFVNECQHITGGGRYCSVRDFAEGVKVEVYLKIGGHSTILTVGGAS